MSSTPAGTADAIWHAYRAELTRFILKRVRDETLAEDLVHDVFMKAYTHWQNLKEPGKLRPWLYQITRNALIDHYRTQKSSASLTDDLISDAGDQGNQAEQELARCMLPLLNQLPEIYRRALTLAEIEGMSQQAIASHEGLSLSGAKSRVQRARTMLRELLLQCCRVEMDQRGGVADYQPAGGCGECGNPCLGAVETKADADRHQCTPCP